MWRGIPCLLGYDLRLAKAIEIFGDGYFWIEAQVFRVGADEPFIEDAAGQPVEVFFFDRLEHARADLSDVRHVIEREFFGLARLAEFVSELTHAVFFQGEALQTS